MSGMLRQDDEAATESEENKSHWELGPNPIFHCFTSNVVFRWQASGYVIFGLVVYRGGTWRHSPTMMAWRISEEVFPSSYNFSARRTSLIQVIQLAAWLVL